ncbi:class I SAM-dependent methyltransferase [Aureliella helgolandensis]|uniref:Demethylrebeccamycin-D-glucose O-methyltransferase n=1 Tax=Aureliella helgolandensis TaxID=2527968 RepID=A0A518G7W0_9BACT|nr:class I SAM-dependent methyltransferase [Aureliella helgolandensis]QDV24671.1 Demethylrebeccamycin-D-glucose O-methyltransferase [Aureliella helgolandensis]
MDNSTSVAPAENKQDRAEISDYYNDTVVDYDAWSREGYLHFGYWRPWMNPFARRPMLEEMNRLIFRHLRLDELESGSVADLGCGVGAVSRFGSQEFPKLAFQAMTISPGQVAEAKQRHADQNVHYYCGDYHSIPLPDASVDGVFYLESLCHSTSPDVALAEAARILKPGGRIVLTDGFLTRPLDRTSRLFRHVVCGVAHNWAVPMFHEIELGRGWTGQGRLKLVEEFECGWRLGPSALHAAHLSLIHFFKLVWQRKVTPWQWKHLTASAYTIVLGLYRKYFRYHLLAFERLPD